MNCIIPLAGNGQRFIDAGYAMPKPLLPMPDGRTLIEHVVSSLPHVDLIITVSKPSLDLQPGLFKPYAWYPVNIKRETRGPVDTLYEARSLLKNKSELLINYCDCFLPDNQVSEFIEATRKTGKKAGVVCFPSHNPRFQMEPTGRFAMSGIFYFKHSEDFINNAIVYRDSPTLSPGHIAFGLRWMGLSQCAAWVTDNIVDLGVPEAYETYLRLHGKVATKE